MVNKTLSTSLSTTDRRFRPYHASSLNFCYKLFRLNVTASGVYQCGCNSQIDTVGYLYKDNFIDTFASQYLLNFNDNGGNKQQFQFQSYLQTNEIYYLVVTTSKPRIVGNIKITIRGRASVDLIPVKGNEICIITDAVHLSFFSTSSLSQCKQNSIIIMDTKYTEISSFLDHSFRISL